MLTSFLMTAAALGGPAMGEPGVGLPAPEISVKEWMNLKPTTIAEEEGNVVVLEFWATW